jgi:hypothetical protein
MSALLIVMDAPVLMVTRHYLSPVCLSAFRLLSPLFVHMLSMTWGGRSDETKAFLVPFPACFLGHGRSTRQSFWRHSCWQSLLTWPKPTHCQSVGCLTMQRLVPGDHSLLVLTTHKLLGNLAAAFSVSSFRALLSILHSSVLYSTSKCIICLPLYVVLSRLFSFLFHITCS